MTASLSTLPNVVQYNQSFYDQTAPQDFFCSITTEMLQNPATINCGENHVFERAAIEQWRQSNSTCPIDRERFSLVTRNRQLESLLTSWRAEHAVDAIESEQLATYLLRPDAIPQADVARLGSYLRYIRAASKTQEVAAILTRLAREQAVPISNLQRFAGTLHGTAGVILDQVMQEANRIQHEDEIANLANPESIMPRMMQAMARLEGRFDRQQRLETDMQASRDFMARLEDRFDRQQRLEAERSRLEQEERQKPLTVRELAGASISVIGTLAAGPLGRGIGAVLDSDPETSFTGEASNFTAVEYFTLATQTVNVLTAFNSGAKAGIRQLNRQMGVQLSAAGVQALRSYEHTMAQDARRLQTNELKESVSRLQKAEQESTGRIEKLEKAVRDAAEETARREAAAKAAEDAAKKAAEDAAKKAAEDAAKKAAEEGKSSCIIC